MQISHQVNEELKRKHLLISAQFTALKRCNLLIDSTYHVTILIQRSILISLVRIDILIMPCACIFVLRSVAGVIHPVSPINDGPSVQKFRNLLLGFLCKVFFSQCAGHIMTLLTPRIAIDRHSEKARSDADQFQ